MKRSMPSMVPVLCAFFSAAALAQAQPAEVTVTAKLRDFKEVSPSDTAGAHPHFNSQNGCSAQELGAHSVQADLDLGGPADGGAFPGDNRTPKLMDSLPATLAKCYTPVDRFGDWFADKPGVNRSFFTDIHFTWDEASGMYRFGDKAFFPLDAGKPFTKADPSGPGTFGNLQVGTVDGVDLSTHDYGFTLEMHTEFIYTQGKGQKVSIQGDDDIWLFLNGKRVVDLGGVHQLQRDSVDLDSLQASLGLEDGKTYPFDFYFAERHTASSSCFISTNLGIGTAVASAVHPRVAFRPAASAGPVAIYDRSGRWVRTLAAPSSAAADWDHLDAQGRPAAPGIYFWRSAPDPAGAAPSGALAAGPAASGRIVVR